MGERLFSRWPLAVALVLALAVPLACTSGDDDADETAESTGPTDASSDPGPTSPDPSTAAPAGDPMPLTVLEYNIEYGGNASTDKVMRSVDADIVGVLESYNRLPEIAANTGYPYYNVGLQLLSKYPILEPSGADGLYALIEVRPGEVVAFFNTHLDYVAYGPRLLANGESVAAVLKSELEVRSSLDIQLPAMKALADAGYPVFLTGDFNQPSSLDYTDETAGSRPGVDDAIAWPVSESLFDIGFRDTFREVYPDPLENPGITSDNPEFREGGVGDRIDYVYAGGPAETLDSRLVGKTGDPNVDIGFKRWTSDHRAVVSSFEVEPVPMPETLALDRRMLTAGDTVAVTYNAPDAAAAEVAVVPDGGDATDALESRDVTGTSGSVTFETADLAPAGYNVLMLDAGGDELQRNEFWVRSKTADVKVTTDRGRYRVGQPVEVSWTDGPANRWDWIGVFRASAADPEDDDYLLWGYTGGHDSGALPPSVSGEMTLDGSSQGRPWPLPPGRYVVHYLLTDQYESAGNATFTVVR